MKTKQLLKLLGALLTMTLLAAACGTSATSPDGALALADEETDSEAEALEDEAEESPELTVAVVAPSGAGDVAFTQSMIDSLGRLGIEPQITDNTFIVEEAAAAIRGYAEDGIDVVIAHGNQYGDPLTEIAPDFPETSFIWGTATDNLGLENVFAYTALASEGGYVNGFIAGSIADGGVIGIVGPVEAGDAVAYIEGFNLGAESVGASTSVIYTGSFSDIALATEAAQTHVDNGAVVLTGTSQSAVGAVNVAVANDIPWFGTQTNTEAWSANVTVASQVYHWEFLLDTMFQQIGEGIVGGTATQITLENGGLVMEFNDGYDIDPDLRASTNEVIGDIISGEIVTE